MKLRETRYDYEAYRINNSGTAQEIMIAEKCKNCGKTMRTHKLSTEHADIDNLGDIAETYIQKPYCSTECGVIDQL